MQLFDITKHINFIGKSNANATNIQCNCYTCFPCIKQQQMIVATKFETIYGEPSQQ